MQIDMVQEDRFNLGTQIKVIGVGGGGGNAVQHMIATHVRGVEFICANTDAQALRRCEGAHKIIQLGLTGLGAGANPAKGREAADNAEEEIRSAIDGAHMLFITAGMGGGTGTGAAPVVARVAREMGILTVGVVTMPFEFEGDKKLAVAKAGLQELQANVDSLIVVLNEKLFSVLDEDTSEKDAFVHANTVLKNAVGGIAEIINVPGTVNADFEDVRTVMSERGKAMMGTATASGQGRAQRAAEEAIACPLLEGVDIAGAKAVLVLISAREGGLKLLESKVAMQTIRAYAAPDVQVIYGTAVDDTLEDSIRVTVVATGLSSEEQEREEVASLFATQGTGTNGTPHVYPNMHRSEAVAPSPLTSSGTQGNSLPARSVAQDSATASATPSTDACATPAISPGGLAAFSAAGNATLLRIPTLVHPLEPAEAGLQQIQPGAKASANFLQQIQQGAKTPANFLQQIQQGTRAAANFQSPVSLASDAQPQIALYNVMSGKAAAKVGELQAAGMEQLTIPAFLRKQAD